MVDKKYSVLMSVYYKENPKFFKLSIESMLHQTLKPDEIVIVKDGKLTEELDRVIDYYVSHEPNQFSIVALEKNLGLGLALNEGLKECKNELVARMDTDDISLENRCELQVEEFIKNEKLSIVGTMTDEFYDNPNNIVTSRIVPTKHEDILKFSRRRSPFNHPTVMYKKSMVLGCEGGYHDVKRKEDIDLFGRMLNQGYIAMNIDKSLLLFRSNEDNFERRKSWNNCKSYIAVIYNFWKKGYSKTSDLIFVVISQVVMCLCPVWLLKILSDRFLRKSYRD
ncbi:glycosyltransferase [Clostridium estertheticum]|uniref:Glycosyltransferase n=1 Tax=Clostridium estertheticum TaxID=238834 RepID=A0AA47EI51_9CLOT|nr:glycosyltransferase [Clostridium estertheticum]MBU3155328.1 glycosyltransferase [Clostridium estertheticum]WAG60386.1 glycosyltransferase [Clostridium estertheticum]